MFLVAVRDGDRVGPDARKQELEEQLPADGQAQRQPDERIATPVPTWSIETWLLSLLGAKGLDEGTSRKNDFKAKFGRREKQAIRDAVAAWSTTMGAELPSLRDGRRELSRLDQS